MNETNKGSDPIMSAYGEWKAKPTPEIARRVIDSLEPQIGTALHTFAPGMEDHLRLKARTIAFGALKTYDPSKGMHLKSYIYQQLQPLQREFGRRSSAVRLPERHILEKSRLDRATADFVDENGREPSLAELAEYTFTPIKRIEKIRSAKGQVSESRTINPETGDSRTSIESDPQEAWAEYIYNSLGAVDQRIYEMTTGYGGTPIQSKGAIARKLGISAPAVSQRINKIAAKLEEGLNLGN